MVGGGRMDVADHGVGATVVRTDVPVGGGGREPEVGARWVSLSGVCTLAEIRRSSTAQAVWQSLALRLHILRRREGWKVNHKRTYRIYRDEVLSIRPKLPKRKRA